MSVGGEAFTAADSAAFSHTVEFKGHVIPKGRRQHTVSASSVYLMTRPGTAKQEHFINRNSVLK